MRRILKIVTVVLAAGLAAAQVVNRPDLTNPPVNEAMTIEAALHPPQSIMATLTRSCGDCHSNATKWPWYSHVAPMSWLVADHVLDGRRALNFSTFADIKHEFRAGMLEELAAEVKKGDMPLPSYTVIHRDAKLNDAERAALVTWAEAAAAALK